MQKLSYFILLMIFSVALAAQEKLTLEDAIALSLKNNYAISLAKNQSEIAKNDVSLGNAGFLPQVSLNASGSISNNDTKQQFSTGASVDRKDAKSNNINPGLALNWTLFDGMKMFATYDKLKELSTMGEVSAKMQIENTIAQIITAYYDMVRQKQLLKAADSTLAIYEERVKIADTRWKTGSGAKTDLLQAQVDRNAQRSVRLKQQNNMATIKIKLNQLLARTAETEFDVTEEIPVNTELKLDELKSKTQSQNSSLLFYQKNILVSELTLKEIKAQRSPKLMLNSNYNFSRTENQVGLLLYSRNLGWNAGLSLSWNLFNGFNTNRLVKNNELLVLNSKLLFDNVRTETEAKLLAAYKAYLSALEILTLEEEGALLAKENVQIALERFRLGSANSLEMKEAQKSYEDALSRLVQTRYDAKLAETELMRLKGELVK